jgi:hypothetical protein
VVIFDLIGVIKGEILADKGYIGGVSNKRWLKMG